MSSTDSSTSGFTVLEALVALALLAGVTSAILSGLMMNQSRQRRSQEHLRVAAHAQVLLERAGLDIPLRPGSARGRFDDGTTWTIEVAPFRDEALSNTPQPLLLFDVQVHVAASSGAVIALRSLKRDSP